MHNFDNTKGFGAFLKIGEGFVHNFKNTWGLMHFTLYFVCALVFQESM